MSTLDYGVMFKSGTWYVWVPDADEGIGAVIGSGSAKTTALKDAIEHLRNTANMMQGELEALQQ